MVYVPRQEDVGLHLRVQCIPGSPNGPQGLWFGLHSFCEVPLSPQHATSVILA